MTHGQHTAPAPATPHGSHAPAGIPDARAVIGTIDLAVGAMTCASCVARVEKKINKVPGATATVNLAIEQAHVELTDEVDAAALIKAVESAGYTATVMRNSLATRGTDAHAHAGHDTTEMALSGHSMGDGEMDADEDTSAPVPDRGADLRRRLIAAAILSVPVLLISMIPALQFPGWQWVVTAAALPVVTWSAWPFHRAAAVTTHCQPGNCRAGIIEISSTGTLRIAAPISRRRRSAPRSGTGAEVSSSASISPSPIEWPDSAISVVSCPACASAPRVARLLRITVAV